MKPILVEVPIKTVSTNKMNGREHWAVRARRTKAERCTTWLMLAACADCRPLRGKVERMTVVLERVSPRYLDDDNLRGALKAVRDAVAEWLGLDDADERLTWQYGQGKGNPSCVRITLLPTVAEGAA